MGEDQGSDGAGRARFGHQADDLRGWGATNHCGYGVAAHIAAGRAAGMTDEMFGELMAVVGLANEANRLVSGYQIEIDKQFKDA